MLPIATLKPLLVAPILISTAAFLSAGALVFIRSSPLVLPGSLFPWLIAATFLPLILAVVMFAFAASDPTMTCFAFFQVPLFVLIIFSAKRSTRGYIVLAVTGESLRSALRAAIAELDAGFEETMLGFSLGAIHNMLRTRYEARLGTAQFLLDSPGNPEVLSQIATRVRHHLQADHQSVSQGSAALYGVFGLIMLILALYQSARL
jgi:hypothetical protein